MALWERLFDLSGLTPHGYCLTWDPGLLWLDAVSDGLIFCAYFSIPLSLIKLVRGRADLLPPWLMWLFAAFILACGTSHAFSILTLWVPAYVADGCVKAITASLSVVAALALRPLVPVLLSLPSRADMERLNRDLDEKKTGLLLAQEAGRIGSWGLDLHSDALEWSASQYALYGLSPEVGPLTRDQWLARVDSDDRDAVAAKLVAATGRDEIYETEFRILRPDGSRRWLAERGRVVAGPAPSPHGESRLCLVGVSIDVTDHNQVAERLTATNQLLSASVAAYAYAGALATEQMRVLFEHSPDAQFVLRVEDRDPQTKSPSFIFEAVNPANERMTGLPALAFVGQRPEDCHKPHESEALNEAFRRCLLREGVTTFLMQRSVRGRLGDFETSLAPVRDPSSGRITRIIGITRDVTERTALEQQLRHVAKMEATHRLTAGIAHDFNNMLQGLMGGLEMLLLEAEAPSLREYAEIALHSAQRGAELTHRLLAFSRQQALQAQPVDAGRLLCDVARILEPTLGKHFRLVAAPAAESVIVMADPEQLEAAIVNLVVNAADAMMGGGQIELSVSLATHLNGLDLPPGPYGVLIVRDTGSGMEPAVLAQACEPFFTTKGVNGSGLGLSMVQGFARQSGGDLCLESALGVGTCAQVWLPLAPVMQPDSSDGKTDGLAPGQLLLVDDAADVLVTAGAFLRHAGFAVTRVSSGQQALQHLATGARCDAIVTDFAMPHLNGIALLQEAQRMRPGLPGLIITGFDRTAMRGHEVGARVLQKPFSRQHLLDEVQAMLSRSGPSQFAPALARALSLMPAHVDAMRGPAA
jgi:PAS domain S-box-containing protein